MVKAIVGACWGDEGKGKITDVLAEDSDIVVRFQGGSNAGHTIINEYGKFALHQLPSGVFRQNIVNVIGNGVALSVENFLKELESVMERGVPKPQLLVSDRCQVVMPYHKELDGMEEARLAAKSFGSTKSGIAPFYSDKYAKIGFQISDLFDDKDSLMDRIDHVLGLKNVLWGLALVITGSKSIAFTNTGIDGLMWIGGGSLFTTYYEGTTKVKFPGIPFSFILVIIVFIIFDIFLRKTALGRQIYCVGGNPEAARLSGIPSKNVLTFVYTLSGFMAGMAGIVSVGRLASANGNAGSTYDNDAIAACIVGGASFTGGKGTIWGTLIGALLMAVIRNGLNLAGAKNDVQYIVIGSVIILAVTIDVFRNKMEAKARKMAAQ